MSQKKCGRKISFPAFFPVWNFYVSLIVNQARQWRRRRRSWELYITARTLTPLVSILDPNKRETQRRKRKRTTTMPRRKCPLAPLCALKDGHVQPQHQIRRKRGEGKCVCVCVCVRARARVCVRLKITTGGGGREGGEGGYRSGAHASSRLFRETPLSAPWTEAAAALLFLAEVKSAGLTHTHTHTLWGSRTHTPSPARNQRATWWIFKVSALRRLTTGAERSTVSQESSCSRAELRSPSRGYVSSSLLRICFCFKRKVTGVRIPPRCVDHPDIFKNVAGTPGVKLSERRKFLPVQLGSR